VSKYRLLVLLDGSLLHRKKDSVGYSIFELQMLYLIFQHYSLFSKRGDLSFDIVDSPALIIDLVAMVDLDHTQYQKDKHRNDNDKQRAPRDATMLLSSF
jgi:hypothetical protein